MRYSWADERCKTHWGCDSEQLNSSEYTGGTDDVWHTRTEVNGAQLEVKRYRLWHGAETGELVQLLE